MAQHTVKLRSAEDQGLRKLAAQERRSPREQIAVIVVRELERAGLVPTNGGAIKAMTLEAEPANVN